MISLKRTAAILLATSLLAVSMAACSKPVSTSSSSSNTSSASSDTSLVSSDASSVTSDTSSVDSSTSSVASGTSSVTPGTSTAKPGTSTAKPGTSTAKPTSSAKPTTFHTTSVAPSNSTSGIVKNMNGRTVIFHSANVGPDDGPKDKHVERMMAKIASIEKQYNCKITLARNENDVGNTKPVQNSIIAGKPAVDIWATGWVDWLSAYVAGLIQPLDAFKCFNFADKTKYFAPTTQPLIVNGVHYGLHINNSGLSSGFQYDQMMFYRYDVLQKSGITSDMMPDTLAKNGQWTWDNFAKICQKVRASGNIPLTDNPGNSLISQTNLYQEMCYTFGSDYVKQDASSKTVTFNGGSAAALAALNLYTSFVKNKTIDAPATDPADMSSVDNIAFSPTILCMAKWLYPRWGTEISKANWGMTYLPKVKASDSYTVVSDQLTGGWSIPYGVKYPADAATVLQALTPFDTDNTAAKAETMMDYELWLPSNDAIATSILRIENECNDIAYTSDQKYVITAFTNGPGVAKDWLTHVQKIATGQEDAASVIAANTGKFNNLLKNLYVIR